MESLDNVPLASIVAVGAVIGGLIALIQKTISYEDFLIGIGATSAGAGLLGTARNGAGKGLSRAERRRRRGDRQSQPQ